MANPRDIVIDIIGQDHTDRAFKSVERNIKSLGDRMGTVTKTMAKAGAMVASFSSLLGPAALGVTSLVTATVQAGQAFGPLVGLLPAVAAGLGLIKVTAGIVGPAMAKSFKPLTDLFGTAKKPGSLRVAIGAVATQELPQLARAFVRINMPAIGGSMKNIAGSMNLVVRGFGAWVNSAEGAGVISRITGVTAVQFRLLGPHITAAAIALGRLTGRGGAGIELLFRGVTRLIDGFTRWADRMTDARIAGALDKAKTAAGGLGEKLRMVKDVFAWIADNPEKIKAMSDALAGVGIALGLASGGWIAVVAGAVTLMANHWDKLKPKFEAAAKWANDTWNAIAADPAMQRIGAALAAVGRTIKGDFVAVWDLLRPKLEAVGRAVQDLWAKMGPLVARVLENPEVRNGLRLMALGLAAVAAAMVVLSAVTASTVAAVIGGLAAVVAYGVGAFVRGIVAAVALALTAFGRLSIGIGQVLSHIPGLGAVGRAMIGAGNAAIGAAGKVQALARSLDQVRSKTVTVTVNYAENRRSVYNQQVPAAARASGGPMAAGRPYWVGEDGPELVTPTSRGFVWPTGTGPAVAGGGGGATTVVNIHISQPLGTPQAIAAAVQSALASASAGGMSLRPMAAAIARAS